VHFQVSFVRSVCGVAPPIDFCQSGPGTRRDRQVRIAVPIDVVDADTFLCVGDRRRYAENRPVTGCQAGMAGLLPG
jgi:hypothetical protein